MRTNTARVLEFPSPKHQKFTSEELHLPKLSRNWDEVLGQVKPLFNEWMLAEGTFEHNTLEVAKAVTRAWEVYKTSEPEGTKIGFTRHFDPTIPEDAKGKDLGSNATYNRIQYLLHKVAPAASGGGTPVLSLRQRMEQKERGIRTHWRRWVKQSKMEPSQLEQVRGLVRELLEEFLPAERVERAVA